MAADLSAVERRAQDAEFIATCQWSTWRARLPLHWPTSLGTPPSPKHAYRSHYVYLGSDDLADPAVWEHLSEFDLLLRFILPNRVGYLAACRDQLFRKVLIPRGLPRG